MSDPEAWETGPPEGLFDAEPAPETMVRARIAEDWTTGDHVEIAQRMLARIESGGPDVIATAGSFWRYTPRTGTWDELETAAMSCVIQGFSGARIPPAGHGKDKILRIKAGDIRGAIEVASHQRHRPDDFFRDIPVGLAFSNGFVRVTAEGCVVEPFAPELRARHAYPFPFDPKADAAAWLKLLAGLFRDDADAAEKIAFLQEFFGACLLGLATRYQRALFCTGKGRNGKSTLLTILRSGFPPRTVSEVAPHGLRDDYSRAILAAKLLNVVTEVPERELLDTESFKALVTGDPLQARHPYGRPFTLYPKAGHAYAPQDLPDVADTSDGFWRRPVVLEFRRQFTDADDDKGIAARLIEQSQSAIVAWLLDGVQRLIANQAYTLPPSHHVALRKWRLGSNNVALFADDVLQPARVPVPVGSHDWTLSSVVYEKYREWVASNGYRGVAINTFGKRLAGLGFESVHTKRGTLYAVRFRAPYDAMGYES